MSWIGVIIVGMTIGLLGRLLAPGACHRRADVTSIWVAVGSGATGVLVGWAVVGDGHPVLRWVASLMLAGVAVVATAAGRVGDRTPV
jgi:hypothetical protein